MLASVECSANAGASGWPAGSDLGPPAKAMQIWPKADGRGCYLCLPGFCALMDAHLCAKSLYDLGLSCTCLAAKLIEKSEL